MQVTIEDKADAMLAAGQLRLKTLDEFCQRPTATWLARGLIPTCGIVLAFGPPKSGKSYAIADMTMHFAHGMHWHGHCIARQLRAAYFAGEGQVSQSVRLHAWRREHAPEREGEFRVLDKALSLPERRAELIALLRDYKPDILVVDTLNTYFGGLDENATGDMTAFVSAIRELIDELGCSVIVIHHTGVADQSRARGSTVLRGSADVIVQVTKDERVPGLFGFQVIEGRDTGAWETPMLLQLRPVEVDWLDDDGKPMCACIVESAAGCVVTRATKAPRFTPAEHRVIAAVEDLARKRSNGGDSVELTVAEIAAGNPGVPRSSIYRLVPKLAPRKGWGCDDGDKSVTVPLVSPSPAPAPAPAPTASPSPRESPASPSI